MHFLDILGIYNADFPWQIVELSEGNPLFDKL